MENASKALLIAAAVLIAILLIVFGIRVFNSPKDVVEDAQSIGDSIASTIDRATASIQKDSFTPTHPTSGGSFGTGEGDDDKKTQEKQPISKTESFVGFYADIDGNESVDGIIYADLAVGGSGTWDSNVTYTIPKTTNLKDYYEIKKEHEESGFGKKAVIAPIDKDEKKVRFYVMSLSDFENKDFSWYYNAKGKMSDYNITTYTAFGKGYDNTEVMLEKMYGNGLRPYDIWKNINEDFLNGWYIPSIAEWGAFCINLSITKDNYEQYGLESCYWSSSQVNFRQVYATEFTKGTWCLNAVDFFESVRLSTTF